MIGVGGLALSGRLANTLMSQPSKNCMRQMSILVLAKFAAYTGAQQKV